MLKEKNSLFGENKQKENKLDNKTKDLNWLSHEVEKYISENGFFKLPKRSEIASLKKQNKGYFQNELDKLIKGISENSGLSIEEIKRLIEDKNINLFSFAMEIKRSLKPLPDIHNSQVASKIDSGKRKGKRKYFPGLTPEGADYHWKKMLGDDY